MKNIFMPFAISAIFASSCLAAATPGAEQNEQAKTLLDEFKAASDEAGRKAAFDKTLASGESAVRLILSVIDSELKAEGRKYVKVLEPAIRGAYVKRLESLAAYFKERREPVSDDGKAGAGEPAGDDNDPP